MIILNFSHPLLPDQLARIETLSGQPAERVIGIKTHVDQQADLIPQVIELVNKCQLSPAEWRGEYILVVLPSLNYVAAALLAGLYGRMGRFPPFVRLRPVEGALPPRFEVAEIIDLQAVNAASKNE